MGISVNGPSGIDTQYIIDSLVQLEQGKVTTVQNQKKAYQVKIDAYAKLKTMLSDLRTKATGLSKQSSFDMFTTKSTNDKVAKVTAGAGSVNGSYDVRVFQLAGNEKMISGNGLIADQNVSLQSLSIDIGMINIDGTDIEVDADDTLQDLRQKINSATDADGNRIDVSASVLKIADDNYRLVLTSKKAGSAGIAYSGATLEDLGIISAGVGKGIAKQALVYGGDINSIWTGVGAGEQIQITGTDRAGKAVSVAFNKKPTDTIADLQARISEAFNGMVETTIDGSGVLKIEDKVGGTSQLSISNLTLGATTMALDHTDYGDEGSGVLSVGKDAFFSVENVFMSNDTNSATGFVGGVTFDFLSVSKDESVTLSLERDMDGITKKFQEMLDNYNALVRFSKANTKVADPNDENAKNGDLAGDMTVRNVISQVNGMFHQQFDELNTVYTSFNMLGLKTDTQNGELTLEGDKFKKALTEKFDEVVNLFTTVGTSTNPNITLGTSTKDTKSGRFVLEEVDSEHFRAQRVGTSTWFTSAARVGDIVSFEDGPLKGLSITAAAGSIGTGNTANFTMSKGLAAIIDDSMAGLTQAQDGLVALRTASWQQSMTRADDKIAQMEERIEKYRLRLVNQFSAMEQALSTIKSQSTNMLNAIGSFSSNNNN